MYHLFTCSPLPLQTERSVDMLLHGKMPLVEVNATNLNVICMKKERMKLIMIFQEITQSYKNFG